MEEGGENGARKVQKDVMSVSKCDNSHSVSVVQVWEKKIIYFVSRISRVISPPLPFSLSTPQLAVPFPPSLNFFYW